MNELISNVLNLFLCTKPPLVSLPKYFLTSFSNSVTCTCFFFFSDHDWAYKQLLEALEFLMESQACKIYFRKICSNIRSNFGEEHSRQRKKRLGPFEHTRAKSRIGKNLRVWNLASVFEKNPDREIFCTAYPYERRAQIVRHLVQTFRISRFSSDPDLWRVLLKFLEIFTVWHFLEFMHT